MTDEIKDLALGLIGLAVLLLAAALLGEAFRAYTLFFVVLWVAIPILACFLPRAAIRGSFTLAGLRRVRTLLMTLVVAISFCTFGCHDTVRNRFGKQFIQGYRHWPAEPAMDDNGQMYYPGDEWTTRNSSGRWAVRLLDLLTYVSLVGLPLVTWKACSRAVNKKEAECYFTTDGKRIEAYENTAWP